MPDAALTLESITRRYSAGVPGCSASVTALSGVSLHVARGECVGIAGGPGSGKTTLLMCAAGILSPDAGTVRADRCVYAPAHGVAHPFLGVRASLEFAASLRELGGALAEPDIDGILERTGLAELAKSRIGALTPGMRARVVVAHVLLAEPCVICLDDPLSALSTAERRRFASLVESLCRDGAAILLSVRDASLCDGVTSRVVELEGGRVVETTRARRTLEIRVGAPRTAATALSARLPSVMRRGRAVRVALDRISPEEVLAACVALGINVTGSRVIDSGRAPARVAEGAAEVDPDT